MSFIITVIDPKLISFIIARIFLGVHIIVYCRQYKINAATKTVCDRVAQDT